MRECPIFAANWKMNTPPAEARAFIERFNELYVQQENRLVAFFPSAVSLEAVALELAGRDHSLVGAQNVHWESSGAFTGELSAPMAKAAGAKAVLVGHSERRQLFGETDSETRLKLAAVLDAGLKPFLCVGETIEERRADRTAAVVERQLLAALEGASPEADLVVAYEPVWAIGTGETATPQDASAVHRVLRGLLDDLGMKDVSVLYGGSVKPGNAAELLAEELVDGLLVGGASLDPDVWSAVCSVG